MTRLEQHRQKWIEEDRMGPLLQFEELTSDEVSLINRTFHENCRSFDANDVSKMYEAYMSALNSWGVMCPHPPYQRHGGGERWFECRLCRAAVIIP